MALNRREQAEYDRLREKARAGRARTTGRTRGRRRDEEDDDGDHIMVFSGRRADTFIDRMFGGGSSDEPDDDDDDDEDEDEDEEPDDEPDDPPAPSGPRFFRGRNR